MLKYQEIHDKALAYYKEEKAKKHGNFVALTITEFPSAQTRSILRALVEAINQAPTVPACNKAHFTDGK